MPLWAIDTDIYKGAEMHAKQNNVSIRELIESDLMGCSIKITKYCNRGI